MKRKLLWIGGGLVAALVGLLVLVPMLVNVNSYRQELSELLTQQLGRKVVIAGDLSFSLLPNPRVSAEGVTVDGFGPVERPMLTVERLRVGVALRPLFDRRLEVQYVQLDRPDILLETYADGTTNYADPNAADTEAAAPQLQVRDLRIKDGTLTLKSPEGEPRVISAINTRMDIESLDGPYGLAGTFETDGMEVELRADGDAQGRLTLEAGLFGQRMTVRFDGQREPTTGRIAGALKVSADSLAEALDRLSDERSDKAPSPAMAGRFTLNGDVTYADDVLALSQLRGSVGETAFTGAITATLAERTQVEARLRVPNLVTAQWQSPDAEPTTFPYELDLPKDIRASVAIVIDRLVHERMVLSGLRSSFSLDKGVITLAPTSVALPGTQLTTSGRIASVDGFARADLALQWTGSDLRRTFAALNQTAPHGLASSSGRARVQLVGDRLTLSDLRATVDGQPLTGSVLLGLGEQRQASVSLAADSLNLDRYTGGPARPAADDSAAAMPVSFAVRAGGLTTGGRTLGTVSAQGRFANDQVDLAQFAIGDVQGYRISGRGTVSGVSKTPALDLTLDARGAQAAATVALTGPQSNLGVQANATVGGATVRATGTVNAAAATPTLAFTLDGSAPELAAVLDRLSPSAQRRRPMGAFALSAQLEGTTQAATLKTFTGRLGPASFQGSGTVSLSGAKPAVALTVALGEVPLRAFLGPADTGAAAGKLDATDRWSREPLDTRALGALTGTLALSAQRVTLDQSVFEAPRATLRFTGAGVTVEQATTTMMGGRVSATGALSAATSPALTLALAVEGVPMEALLQASAAMTPITGTTRFEGRFSGQGASQAAIIASLAGQGSLSATNGVVRKVNLPALNERLGTLGTVNDFIRLSMTALQGGETAYRTLGTTFTLADGVARLGQVTSDMDGGTLTARGTIDLPRWRTDLAGAIQLDEITGAPPIGFSLVGPIAATQARYDLAGLQRFFAVRVANAGLRAVVRGEGFDPRDLIGLGKAGQTPDGQTQAGQTQAGAGATAPATTPAQKPSGIGGLPGGLFNLPATKPAPSTPPSTQGQQQAAQPKPTPEEEVKGLLLQGLGSLIKRQQQQQAPQQPPPAEQPPPQ